MNQPDIDLTVGRTSCPLHLAPYKSKWPMGYAIFVGGLLDTVLADPQFQQEADGKTQQINVLLDLKPLCCRVFPERLMQVYEQSKIGKIDVCTICELKALGTQIETAQEKFSHLCFSCVLYRLG